MVNRIACRLNCAIVCLIYVPIKISLQINDWPFRYKNTKPNKRLFNSNGPKSGRKIGNPPAGCAAFGDKSGHR